MNKKATAVGILSTLFTLSAVLMNTQYSSVVLAQEEGPPGEAGVTDEPESPFTPFNETATEEPETATELEEYAGSDQAILANDTAISNPNNTVLDSTDVNIREDCMQIPGNTAEDCP
ncbi:MAG: hypothetical protein WBX01_05250 [Nitrososphaeraceae archaeon]